MDVAPTAPSVRLPARAAMGEDVCAMESEPSSPLRRVTNVIWRAHSEVAHSEGAAQAFLKKEAMPSCLRLELRSVPRALLRSNGARGDGR